MGMYEFSMNMPVYSVTGGASSASVFSSVARQYSGFSSYAAFGQSAGMGMMGSGVSPATAAVPAAANPFAGMTYSAASAGGLNPFMAPQTMPMQSASPLGAMASSQSAALSVSSVQQTMPNWFLASLFAPAGSPMVPPPPGALPVPAPMTMNTQNGPTQPTNMQPAVTASVSWAQSNPFMNAAAYYVQGTAAPNAVVESSQQIQAEARGNQDDDITSLLEWALLLKYVESLYAKPKVIAAEASNQKGVSLQQALLL